MKKEAELPRMGLTDEDLAACAASSFRHSLAPERLRLQGLRGIEVACLNGLYQRFMVFF